MVEMGRLSTFEDIKVKPVRMHYMWWVSEGQVSRETPGHMAWGAAWPRVICPRSPS